MKGTQPNSGKGRLSRRIIQHHLPLLGGLALAIFLFYRSLPQKDVIWKLSFVTAYPALLLLMTTLLIGPWKLLRGRRTGISSDLRRDIGIWAGILGVIHTGVGLFVHLRGRPWLYFVYGKGEHHHAFAPRHDLFGASNDFGLIGAVILVLLLVTSNDYSLRRFGKAKWKQLQRWNYLLFAVVILHSFGYQRIEKQHAPFVALVIVCLALTVLLQVYGYRLSRTEASGRRLPRV